MGVLSDQPAALAAYGADAIAKGSKSFALASLFFDKETQAQVHMLYAWCRHCDDVIDGQTLGGDAPDATLSQAEMQSRLETLRAQTRLALADKPTGAPAFDGFATVVRRCAMPERYPMDLLKGFAQDVDRQTYPTIDDLMGYCYGVAGVVGVMMAIVMGVAPDEEETLDRACDLGLAFQLTNVCRDVIDDAAGGRIYLPLDWLSDAGVPLSPEAVCDVRYRDAVVRVVHRTLFEADRYYASASQGARRLPLRAASAVLAARNVYREIGRRVINRGARAWDSRTVISAPRKAWLAASGITASLVQAGLCRHRSLAGRDGLWSRSPDNYSVKTASA
ncbi:MAG: phytoene/squalene synthase family protein [Pseudomonadota bacterium]